MDRMYRSAPTVRSLPLIRSHKAKGKGCNDNADSGDDADDNNLTD